MCVSRLRTPSRILADLSTRRAGPRKHELLRVCPASAVRAQDERGTRRACAERPRDPCVRERPQRHLRRQVQDESFWPPGSAERCSSSIGVHVSGSAFKLVNARAYHHGTMLIDAKLGDLKGVLGNSRVRFPVCVFHDDLDSQLVHDPGHHGHEGRGVHLIACAEPPRVELRDRPQLVRRSGRGRIQVGVRWLTIGDSKLSPQTRPIVCADKSPPAW